MSARKPLRSRLSVAAWGIPLIAFTVYFGGWLFALFIALIAAVALYEFYSLAETQHLAPQTSPAVLLSVPAVLSAQLFSAAEWLALMFFLAFLLVLIEMRFGERCALRDVPVTIFGWVYIPLLMGSLIYIRAATFEHPESSWLFLLYFFSAVWICDTAAYAGGKRLGRHKMTPYISPNKTWEGAFFGFAGALGWGVLWMKIFPLSADPRDLICVSLIVGTIGQLGDLVESYFKRSAGVKDSGSLLPEHGGALDRFDSLILAAPFVFIYLIKTGRIALW